jgi:hypothetical protein
MRLLVALCLVSLPAYAETVYDPNTIPIAPSHVEATMELPGQVLVRWRDNADNEDVFDVQRKVGDAAFVPWAGLSKNLTAFRDFNVPVGTAVYYRVRARNKAGASFYSLEGKVIEPVPPSDVVAKWDFIDSFGRFTLSKIVEKFSGDEGKPLMTTLELGSKYRATSFGRVPTVLKETLESVFGVSAAEQTDLWATYSNGVVPFRIGYEVERVAGSRTLIYRAEGTITLRKKQDNYEYKIALFHVAEPGVDLSKLNVCLVKDSALGGDGYVPVGNVVSDCAAKWDWGTNAPTITTRSYPVMNLLFGNNQTARIEDVTSGANQRERRAGALNVFSLRYLGTYWQDMLARNQAVSTARLGNNPRFRFDVLPIVYAKNTLASNDHGLVKDFFAGVVKSVGRDLSGYDFVVYAIYYPNGYKGGDFLRSFAAARNSYISVGLSSDNVLFNSIFLTIAHELGHQLFSLPDRYDGFGLKYPSGVPQPGVFPQRLACLMAKGFAWDLATPTLARTYKTVSYTDAMQTAGLARFHTEDVGNQTLCPEDVLKIRGY